MSDPLPTCRPRSGLRTAARLLAGFVIIAVAAFAGVYLRHTPITDWRSAATGSVGIAPLAANTPEAVVLVYAARTVKWRGYFAVHTWIAVKAENAVSYTTLQVIGFRLKRTGSAVVIEDGLPDRRWYGAAPELIAELRGPRAAAAIPKILAAAKTYPYPREYRAWPGPNSNTFTSWVLRHTPELATELPPHAIGKDWPATGFVGGSESGTGLQLSVLGVAGVTLGLAEGIEMNLLGLSLGVDVARPALKLPFWGRLGMPDAGFYADGHGVTPAGADDQLN